MQESSWEDILCQNPSIDAAGESSHGRSRGHFRGEDLTLSSQKSIQAILDLRAQAFYCGRLW